MKNVDLWFAVSRFLESKENPETRRTYRGQLIKFVGWVVESTGNSSPTLKFLTRAIVSDYLASESARGVAPATLRLNAKTLFLFDAWLSRQGIWARQLENYPMPQIPEPSFSSASESLRLSVISAALTPSSQYKEQAKKAIAYCYAGLGLRRSEPLPLKCSQLDIDSGVISAVRMKGKIYRSKVIARAHISIFTQLIDLRLKFLDGRQSDYLFLSDYRGELRPIHDRTAARWISDYGTRAHLLRHAYARALLFQTKNIRAVAYELGHSCLTTTLGYTRATEDERRCYHDELHSGSSCRGETS